MPFTFFKKQIFPPTPPRFVKFKDRALSLTHGASSTVPTSDHVPELMKCPVVANRRNRGDGRSRVVAGRDDDLRFTERREAGELPWKSARGPNR